MKFKMKEFLCMDNVNNYFVLPKKLLTKAYSDYSIKSKLLFSIVLTEAEDGTSICELAKLIDDMGTRNVSVLFRNVHNELAEHQLKSEGM